MIVGSVGVWGQQVIGAFPGMDGGMENQTAGALTVLTSLATGAQSTIWTVNGTSVTATINSAGGRSGPKFVTYGSTTSTARRLQSPTANNAAIVNATNYIIQFYYKTSGATAPTNTAVGINWDGTGTSTTATTTSIRRSAIQPTTSTA